MDLLSLVHYYLSDVWIEQADASTSHLPLMSGGPAPILLIIGLYVAFVKVIGPVLMMDRKPFSLRPLMLFFNSFMLSVNAIGFVIGLLASDWGSLLWSCQQPPSSSAAASSSSAHHHQHRYQRLSSQQQQQQRQRINPSSVTVSSGSSASAEEEDFRHQLLIHLAYVYLCIRILDMGDTVFFVLRKKFNHISFLHVFHHASVPLIAFIGLKFHPHPSAGFLPMSNVFVHTFMYAYYAMSCMGPQISQYIWWKKHLTQMQLLQFLSVLAHGIYTYATPDCHFPPVFALSEIIISITFFTLFARFYCHTYHVNITGNKYKSL